MRKQGLTSIELFSRVTLVGILAALLHPASIRAEAGNDSAKTNGPVLHTRTFKMDPNTFFLNLQNVSGKFSSVVTNVGSVDDSESRALRYYPNPAIAERMMIAGYFNAIGINLAPPKGLSYNDDQDTLIIRATDNDLKLIEQAINTLKLSPPQVTLKIRLIEIKDDDVLAQGFEWYLKSFIASGTNATVLAGILTAPQLKPLLKILEKREVAELLNETEITTLSGRQAQFEFGRLDPNGGDTNNPPTLDVVPLVAADGYTIQLTLISTATERVDHLATGNIASPPTNSAVVVQPALPLPHMRVHQTVINGTVWDGQTAVILFKQYGPHKNNAFVFVTPTVIDAAGNRKNLDENMPFAENATPPQTPPKF